MNKSGVSAFFMVAASLFLLLSSPLTARAAVQILSVPGHPVYLVLDIKDGMIDTAFLRSPAGLQKLLPLEGLTPAGERVYQFHADEDFARDLIWVLSFTEPSGRSKGIQLWIGALGGEKKAWVDICPLERTYWDAIPFKLNLPEDVVLYMSPSLPQYEDLPRFSGNSVLTFVYTISLTPDGFRFVPAPEVYKQLQRITEIVWGGETLPYKKKSYEHLMDDFVRLSLGSNPSAAVIRNFTWNRILYLQWK